MWIEDLRLSQRNRSGTTAVPRRSGPKTVTLGYDRYMTQP